jgi:hypothetical protein
MANKRKLIMANRKILSLISKIRKSYPNIKSISCEFEAKGEEFSNVSKHFGLELSAGTVSLSKDEINAIRYSDDMTNLLVEIMFVDNRAGFSNEDSRGSILIDFKEGFIKVNVEVASWTDLGESKIDLKRQKNLKRQNKY